MRLATKRFILFGISFLFLWGRTGDVLCAQELTLGGVGPINHSLAGAAVALPRDSAGAIQWNPATISFLEQSEIQLGMGRHNAPWYGDEPVGYTALIGVYAVFWIWSQADDSRTEWGGKKDSYSTPNSEENEWQPPSYWPGATPKIRVPELSFVYNKDRHWAFGLAVSENGARKVGSVFEPGQGELVGVYQYQCRSYEFVPTVSYRESKRFSFGLSPIFSIDETPNASLPIIDSLSQYSGSPGPSEQDQRSRAGVGLQIGVFYTPAERLRFGFSLRSPQWINGFTYRWIDPVTGEIGTRRLSFSQDSAFRIALGTSYTLRNEQTTLAADFRYYDYSHASALYDIPASFDPEVGKLGISRGVYSLALGAEHRWKSFLAFRAGYQFNHAVTPDKAVIYNTSLPIQSGHSIHYGLTFFFGDHFDLSFSISNAFGGGWETLQTEDGSVRFRCNPNRSNFWIAGRILF